MWTMDLLDPQFEAQIVSKLNNGTLKGILIKIVKREGC